MAPLAPVYTADRLLPLHHELVTLLRRLSPADWLRPTAAGAWRVRDVVAHLLDTDLRRLSAGRDGHAPVPDRRIDGYDDLVAWLNELNADWIRAAGRLSPRVLLEWIEMCGPSVAAWFVTRDPHGPALYPVAWADEDRSEHWFDTGREYTERWHHQLQIREAVGAPGLLDRRWLHPVIALSVRALPRAFRRVAAPPGTTVLFEVTGDAADAWRVVREPDAWRVEQGAAPAYDAAVRIDGDAAWRMLFNALDPAAARARAEVTGDATLAEPLFGARAVMV
jgi:uncharacterized protein (TIGR03083 family)